MYTERLAPHEYGGLTEPVILSIAQSAGALSDRTVAMMIIMVLVATVMAGPITHSFIPC